MGERRSSRKNASLISDKLALHRRNVFSNHRCEDARAPGGFLTGNGAKHSGAAQPRAGERARANLFLLLIEDIILARVNSLWDARQTQVPTSKLQGCNLLVAVVRG